MLKPLLKTLAVAGIGVVGSCSFQPDALAAWPVIDVSNLSRNTITSLQMVQDVAHQITQIENQIRQYQAMLQSMKSLDSISYNQVRTLTQAQTNEFNDVFYALESIGYSLNRIDGEYNSIYPQGSDWNNISYSDYEQYYRAWNRELSLSAKTAMKAQSSVQRTRAYNDEIAAILARSDGAEGQVQQLQAQNQLLAVMGNQLGDLSGTLASSGRITANMAAQAAAQREADLNMREHAISGYGGERIDRKPPKSMQ